jgi:2-methylcitrate dehydratase
VSLAYRLAQYAYQFTSITQYPITVEAQALTEAKRRILDSLGCALGAMNSTPAHIAQQLALMATPVSGYGATPLGTLATSTTTLATFANGVLFRYLDFNDTYLSKEPAHPSDNIAVALAVAEDEGKTGLDLLKAIVLGYELQCRLCDAASIRVKGWDHVTYGALSSAMVAGVLMDLNPTQLAHALALAATPNVAMRQTRVGELSHWKGCAFANAARNGVFAAQLARLGMTGPSDIF